MDKELSKQFVEIAGYWKRREIAASAGSDLGAELHEMSELLPPLAIRTAVTVGIFSAVDGGVATSDAIARACSTDPGATAKLLRHLTLMNLLTHDGVQFGLTDMGSILADQDTFTSQALDFGKIHSRLDMAFLGLLESVRTGKPATGHGFAAKSNDSGFAADFHEEAAFGAVYRAPALPAAVDLTGVETVAFFGEGAGVFADTLARLRPDLSIRLVGLPAQGARNAADIAESRRGHIMRLDASEFTPLAEPVDLVVAVDMVDTHPDADARLLVAALAASGRRVVLITDLLDPTTTDDHDTEDDLRRLCLYGSGRRSEAELRALLSDTDFTEPRFGSLGWGSTVVEFGSLG